MCLGSSIPHRISRIVFACQDHHGGATSLEVKSLPLWYSKKWPVIESGLMKEESYNLLIEFMKRQNNESWNKIMKLFKEMHEKW